MSDTALKDGDYDLVEGGGWFTVNNVSIRIRSDDEQVIAEMYPLGREMDDLITVTRVFFADVSMSEDAA